LPYLLYSTYSELGSCSTGPGLKGGWGCREDLRAFREVVTGETGSYSHPHPAYTDTEAAPGSAVSETALPLIPSPSQTCLLYEEIEVVEIVTLVTNSEVSVNQAVFFQNFEYS
jgi:hypothetical protein